MEGARDNLKFLATLERHFEVLETGSLTAVADAMAPLMAALRMVWIISRHYGDDERMGALFSRIATKLADRIEAAVQTQACPVGRFEILEVEPEEGQTPRSTCKFWASRFDHLKSMK